MNYGGRGLLTVIVGSRRRARATLLQEVHLLQSSPTARWGGGYPMGEGLWLWGHRCDHKTGHCLRSWAKVFFFYRQEHEGGKSWGGEDVGWEGDGPILRRGCLLAEAEGGSAGRRGQVIADEVEVGIWRLRIWSRPGCPRA